MNILPPTKYERVNAKAHHAKCVMCLIIAKNRTTHRSFIQMTMYFVHSGAVTNCFATAL